MFVMALTTILTAVGEERDPGTLVELLHAIGAALAASRPAGLVVVDVLGEKISEKSVWVDLRKEKVVIDAIAELGKYF